MALEGGPSEDLVTEICSRLFFRDFVVRNPKFQKESGLQKEAADVLVLDDETLLAIQIKAKELRVPPSNVDLGRLTKAINEGVAQLKTLRRAVAARQLTHVVTLRGIEIPLAAQREPQLIGVVVLDVRDEEKLAKEVRPTILAGLGHEGDTPAHIFLRSTFECLAAELDTLPDFLDYLKCRQRLLEGGVLSPFTEELDLLALYKTNLPLVEDALGGKVDILHIGEGTWDEYVASGHEMRARRRAANAPSYLIDEMIDYFASSLYQAPVDSDQKPAKVEEYFAVVSELARMRRVERRVMGEKIIQKLKAATSQTFALTVMADPGSGNATLFLCTARPRDERIMALQNMTRTAAYHLGATDIIGIATEPEGTDERTFDAVIYRDVVTNPEDEPTLAEMAKAIFGPLQRVSRQEWE